MDGDGKHVGPRFGLAIVRGRSMEPTLREGNRLLVRYGADPAPDRLVVVRLPDGVIAVKRATRRVPGGWWVERDNRLMGVDSSSVGPISDTDLVATVVCRIWPVSPRRLHRPPTVGGPDEQGKRVRD